MHSLNGLSWGPSSKGIKVQIDPNNIQLKDLISLDIETDEKDNFVGCGIYDGVSCIYVTNQTALLTYVLGKQIIGYNVKTDFHWLRQIGVQVVSSQIYSDPMIMSYVINSNRESQGLKDVVEVELKRVRPSYKDIVGKGKAKRTLDKQEVAFVAEYCCQDAIDAWDLHFLFDRVFMPAQRKLYEQIELPVYRMLWDMEVQGIKIDTQKLETFALELKNEIEDIEVTQLQQYDKEWNPRSPKQTIEVLNNHGIPVKSTDKVALLSYKGIPIVDSLLRHRRITKLYSTYVDAFRNLKTLPYIHTTFNQVSFQQDEGTYKGIRTGRLSSNNPNLQNIPIRGDGEKLRELFIPNQGKVMIDADYSQIEYRLLAHFTREPALLDTFRSGGDVHTTTGRLLNCDRSIGKTLNFASIYGAQAGKIALTAGITESQAETFLKQYWAILPRVRSWIDRIKFEARSRKGVYTMSGRWIPLPEINSKKKFERLHWERAAVNYVIQGSAADIIKVAMLEVKNAGHNPILQVHDELIFEVDPNDTHRVARDIKRIMEHVTTLSIPIKADVHLGYNWREAKE
jgi:DNA polymerase I